MKITVLFFLICCGTIFASEKQIPQTYNVQLPALKEAKLERPEKTPPFNNYIRDVLVQLSINKKGKVKEFHPVKKSDSLFVSYYETNIEKLKFEPAKINGKKSDIKIVIRLRFRPKGPIPDVMVPIDSLYNIDDKLYSESFKANNYMLPMIKSFPSYFTDVEFKDSLTSYDYMLMQADIDKSGKLLSSKILYTTLPNFNWQLQSAVQWSEFSPMIIKDASIESKIYFLISFFPQLSYPTKNWTIDLGSDQNLFKRIQIRNLIDTLGLLSPPVPAFYPPEKLTASTLVKAYYDSTICLVNVDQSGKLRIKNIGTTKKNIRSILLKLSKNMRMFPALDFDNNPVEYEGLVKFVLDGRGAVIIDYQWF